MAEILNQDNVSKHVAQITSILPSHVVEDYPRFVEFVKAYYKWSASEGPLAAMNYMKVNNDIDLVSESMMDSFSSLFAYNLPKELQCDYRFFLKFLKQFYEIKGTDESYRILYRALFNEGVLILHPRRNLFMTSAASWAVDKTFLLNYDGDGFQLMGMTIKGANNGYRCLVSNVIKQDDNWVIFFQSETGRFDPNEIVEIVELGVNAKVVSVYSIQSIDSKARWHDNDVIKIENDLIVKVDKIHYGYIESVSIADGGSGYKVGDLIFTESDYSGTGFKAEVSQVDGSGKVESILLKRSGFGYVNENVWFVGGSGTGLKLTPTWNADFRKIQAASIVMNKPKPSTGIVSYSFGDNETITFNDGAYIAPKYWKVIRGAPSTETARLHDSYYYQEFSYVLSSIADAKPHEESLKKLLQIAGLKMFIEQNISSVKDESPSLELEFQ